MQTQIHNYNIEEGDYSYREFHIKKRNGKTRRICAPSPDLLRFQRHSLQALENLFKLKERELLGEEILHGFVKDRNIVTCARKHLNKAHTITMDISNCFDSITKDMLSTAGLSSLHPYYFHKNGSLAQGFATSPILANYYLIQPMKEVMEGIKIFDPTAVITVYADDIQISLSEQTYTIQNFFKDFVTKIFSRYGLTINPSKTRTHHAKYGNRRILGIMVGESELKPSRKLKGKIRAARYQKNGPSLGGLVTASRMYLPRALRDTSTTRVFSVR